MPIFSKKEIEIDIQEKDFVDRIIDVDTVKDGEDRFTVSVVFKVNGYSDILKVSNKLFQAEGFSTTSLTVTVSVWNTDSLTWNEVIIKHFKTNLATSLQVIGQFEETIKKAKAILYSSL